MKVYKIRDKETGLFSKGGNGYYLWNKVGKSWSTIGHLKLHLNMFNKGLDSYPYKNAEIIEVEINYDDCLSYSVDDIMDEIQLNRNLREQKSVERREMWKRERELKQLEELRNKYESK